MIALTTPRLKHQGAALLAAAGRPAFAYLMDPRTGKTFTTLVELVGLNKLGRVKLAIIVMPKGVLRDDVWGQEFRRRFSYVLGDITIHAYRGGTSKREQGELKRLLVSAGLTLLMIHWDALLTERGYKLVAQLAEQYGPTHTMLVLDEAHRMKTPGAKRTRRLLALGRLAAYRRILTGSLVANSPLDIWAPFQFLDPDILGCKNFWAFKTRYAVLERRRYGNGPTFNQVIGYQNLDELKGRIAPYSYSVTVAECFDLPPRQYLRVPVDLAPEQARAYLQMRDDFMTELDRQPMTAALAITRLLRLQQLIGGWYQPDGESPPFHVAKDAELLPREEALLRHVQEAPGKVVVWARFIPERIRLIDVVLRGTGVISAENGYRPAEPGNRIERFRVNSAIRVLVASPEGPAGEGVDLSCADTMIYYSNSFRLTARVQSEARCENMTLRRPVQVIDLVATGTVDEHILARLQEKDVVARAFNGKQLMDWLR